MVGVHQWVHAHPKVVADVRETGRGALATHAGGMQRRRLRSSGLLAWVGSTKECTRTRRGWLSRWQWMHGFQALGGGRTTAAKLELAAASMVAASRSARAAPESEGGRVEMPVSDGAARALC